MFLTLCLRYDFPIRNKAFELLAKGAQFIHLQQQYCRNEISYALNFYRALCTIPRLLHGSATEE